MLHLTMLVSRERRDQHSLFDSGLDHPVSAPLSTCLLFRTLPFLPTFHWPIYSIPPCLAKNDRCVFGFVRLLHGRALFLGFLVFGALT